MIYWNIMIKIDYSIMIWSGGFKEHMLFIGKELRLCGNYHSANMELAETIDEKIDYNLLEFIC